jgi:hypothetical protein
MSLSLGDCYHMHTYYIVFSKALYNIFLPFSLFPVIIFGFLSCFFAVDNQIFMLPISLRSLFTRLVLKQYSAHQSVASLVTVLALHFPHQHQSHRLQSSPVTQRRYVTTMLAEVEVSKIVEGGEQAGDMM